MEQLSRKCVKHSYRANQVKRDCEGASLTIDDLRSRLLSGPAVHSPESPAEEKASEKWSMSRACKQYILACVCGVVVALLIIGFMD